MKMLTKKSLLILSLLVIACGQGIAQQGQELTPLQPVVPPAQGTFYFLSDPNSPPYPFDPSYGMLNVYEWREGVYLVDDSQLSGGSAQTQGGAAMLTSGPPVPCDPCPPGDTNSYPKYQGNWTTNAGLKFAAIPFVHGGMFSTSLQEADTNSAYEIYEAFQMTGSTVWSRIVAGEVGQTNFAWPLAATNRAFYSAADAIDSDFDGLLGTHLCRYGSRNRSCAREADRKYRSCGRLDHG
jgi:hypothetical protein